MSFIEELKRRNGFRVGIAHAVVAWLIAQVADLAFETIAEKVAVQRELIDEMNL